MKKDDLRRNYVKKKVWRTKEFSWFEDMIVIVIEQSDYGSF